MKPKSFRLRIALLSALISGTVLVAFSATSWLLMYRARLASLDRAIRALACRHPGWMRNRANYERLSEVIELVFGEERKEQLLLLVSDASNRTRYRSPHWPAELDSSKLDLRLADAPKPEPRGVGLTTAAETSDAPDLTTQRGAS